MKSILRKTLVIALVVIALTTYLFSIPFSSQAASTEWQPNVSYVTNQMVIYQAQEYRCLQSHTSLVGWEPPNVAALWTISTTTQPPTGTSTPTQTPTPTSTSTPTKKPTATPTNPANTNTPTPTINTIVDKINLEGMEYAGDLVVTGTNPREDSPLIYAYDGLDETIYVSDGQTTPSNIQFAFKATQQVNRIRVLIGEPGYAYITTNWWLEAADNATDLTNKSGTYVMVQGNTLAQGEWFDNTLSTPVTKKIWKFTLDKNTHNEMVTVPEIEFYGSIVPGKYLRVLDQKQERKNLKMMVSHSEITGGGMQNDAVENAFDDNIDSDYIAAAANPVILIEEFKKAKPVKEIKAYLGKLENQSWNIETADTMIDLKNKTGSYFLVSSSTTKYRSAWATESFSTPILKKIWKITVKNTDSTNPSRISDLIIRIADDTAPSIPQNVAAVAKDARTVQVSWNVSSDNEEVSGYRIYRNGQYIGDSISSKYTDTLLNPNTDYTYQVRAYDSSGNRSYGSQIVSARTTTSMAVKNSYNVTVVAYNPVIPAGSYTFYNNATGSNQTVTVAAESELADLYPGIDKVFLYDKPQELAEYFANELKKASGGSANLNITLKVLNKIAPTNAMEYQTPEYLFKVAEMQKNNQLGGIDLDVFHHNGFNYHQACVDADLIEGMESGNIDFVLAVNCVGGAEITMVGNNPHDLNGAVRKITCSQNLIFATLSIHCTFEPFLHMLERTMEHYAGSYFPASNTYQVLNSLYITDANRALITKNVTDPFKFLMTDSANYDPYKITPRKSQVGNAHFHPGSSENYSCEYVREYFDNYEKWEAIDGQWNCINSQYRATKSTGSKSLLFDKNAAPYLFCKLPQTFTDFSVNCDVILENDGDPGADAGMLFGILYYGTGFNNMTGYYAALDANAQRVRLYRYQNNSRILLASASVAVNPGVSYKLAVQRDNSVFKVSVDGVLLIDYSNAAYIDELPGGIGLASQGVSAKFDTFELLQRTLSYADTWYNYPNLTGSPTIVNPSLWDGDREKWHLWVLSHIPRNPGIHNIVDPSTGNVYKALNNWWPLILDINRFEGTSIDGYTVTDYPVPSVINLTGTPGNGNYTLQWLAPASAQISSVKVYKNNVLIGTTSANSFVDNQVNAGNNDYAVIAVDASGKESLVPATISY